MLGVSSSRTVGSESSQRPPQSQDSEWLPGNQDTDPDPGLLGRGGGGSGSVGSNEPLSSCWVTGSGFRGVAATAGVLGAGRGFGSRGPVLSLICLVRSLLTSRLSSGLFCPLSGTWGAGRVGSVSGDPPAGPGVLGERGAYWKDTELEARGRAPSPGHPGPAALLSLFLWAPWGYSKPLARPWAAGV